MKKFLFGTAFLLIATISFSQDFLRDVNQTEQRLRNHISYLASDALQGRESGSTGEQKAIDYLVKEFTAIGLSPAGSKGYTQSFQFTQGVAWDASKNKFSVGTKTYALHVDFIPLPYSSSGKVSGQLVYVKQGLIFPSVHHDDYQGMTDLKGKIFVIDMARPWKKGEDSTRFTGYSDFRMKMDTAISKGAAAIVFINLDSGSLAFSSRFRKSDWSKIASTSVPVIGWDGISSKDILSIKNLSASIEIQVNRIQATANNVIAYLDNGAENTIVVGAHMDHLGYGEEESSLYRGESAIHNGADDNASGTAGVVELARELKSSPFKKNNYLFICFSGEEKGLLGSAYFVKNPTIDLSKINYMINMDMVGRLKNDEKTLFVYGTGTSPEWKSLMTSLSVDGLQIRQTESGIGPSDHTSFYLKNIPVLHFFTGFHSDYHKPSDDADKINYAGEISILKYILNVISTCDAKGKLAFTKTKEEAVSSRNTSGRPKTTLGIIPDYNPGNGEGLKIDGVVEGKPAEAAGMKSGDVIMRIGDYKIADMQSYMEALSHFKKEDKTTVKVNRAGQELLLPVDFNVQPPTTIAKAILTEKNYRIYDVKQQKEVSVDDIISSIMEYDVLFFGEEHNDSVGHYLEQLIFEKMFVAFGNKTALSMEMFDRDVQSVMNEYLADFIREKNFKKDARVWSNYRDYRPMVELAKKNQLDVICANAAGRYSNLAGRKGSSALQQLPKQSKVNFAPLPYDTASGKYYEKLMEMSGHSPSDTAKPKMPAMAMGSFNLVAAQSLWDATMAYSISEFCKKNKGKKILQVNGRFHSDQKFAVVEQLKKMNSKLRSLVISCGSDEKFPAINWKDYSDLGDFIIITDPSVPKTYAD